MDGQRLRVVAALGTAQTLAWGSSYYLPAILADPIARDLSISSNWFFAAFSASLVISGLLGPRVGRQIDRVGGRQVLCASNVVLAAGLALLGASSSVWMMSAAWLLLGIGMGLGLYDAAFGALGRIYGSDARASITGITLIAASPQNTWRQDDVSKRRGLAALALRLGLLVQPELKNCAMSIGRLTCSIPNQHGIYCTRRGMTRRHRSRGCPVLPRS